MNRSVSDATHRAHLLAAPGSRCGKSDPSAWTDDAAVALDDPDDSQESCAVTSCIDGLWQKQRLRRNGACGSDLRPSLITSLTRRVRSGVPGERHTTSQNRLSDASETNPCGG